MTKTERQALKKEAHWRVERAYAAALRLTGRRRLSFKIARLLLSLSTDELGVLK